MTEHDPLCPGDMQDALCECAFIAKVRADERERIGGLARSGVQAEARAVRELEAALGSLAER